MRKALVWIVATLPVATAAEEIVIAALGDSLTQGYGLAQGSGLVPQLQDWLNERGLDARLINAGVSGDTTAGGLSRVAWTLTPDVDGMVVALGGNDILRGLDPAQSRENIEGILNAARDADVEVLLVGLEAPGNFGPEYKAEFDAIYPELAAQYGVLHAESFFEGFGPDRNQPVTVQSLMQPDGIHPNADGVNRIVDSLGPKVADLIGRISK